MKNFFLLFTLLHLSLPSLAATRELTRLLELSNINSGSANISGVATVQNKIKPWFEALGFKVTLVPNPEGDKKSAPLRIRARSIVSTKRF